MLIAANIARGVLQFALTELVEHAANPGHTPTKIWGIDFGKRWIGALHDGFRNAYADTDRFSVFSRARAASGPASSWRRQEYLYDVVVVEAERREAPIHASALVPVVTRGLWQVESEVGLSASGVAEDLGKLVLGSSESKLLIAAVPANPKNFDDWMGFIEKAAIPVSGNFFLALIPTYSTAASAHTLYLSQEANVRFYTRIDNCLKEDAEPIRCLPIKDPQ